MNNNNVVSGSAADIYDVCIIGAGPGGYRAAEYAAKRGLKVAIIEQGDVGGTCLNVGCIPTKTYVHSATFAEARERMATVVAQLRTGVEGILSHPNITLLRGKASFVDAHTVSVVADGSVGNDFVVAKNIIIATGSETKWLPIEGVKTDPRVVDSTGLLNLEQLPKRLAIIGAGVIGMEFASVFHRFGSEVTVIEYLKECLPALDSDIAKRLRKQMEKEGIAFNMQCGVKRIADGHVFFETKKGRTESVEADVILMATGRKPRTEGLNLEAAGITLAPNGAIPVDDNFQVLSNSPCLGEELCSSTEQGSQGNVYAIGDVNARQMLAHAAEMQAIRAVNHILTSQSVNGQSVNGQFVNGQSVNGQSPDSIRFDIMPAAIFTVPEAACVGPTEDQLKASFVASGFAAGPASVPAPANPASAASASAAPASAASAGPATVPAPAPSYTCHKAFWRANGKALAMGETEGMLKLFSDSNGLILGCHAFGAHAADIVQEVSVLMCRDTTISQLRDMVHIHPTLSEILLQAVQD